MRSYDDLKTELLDIAEIVSKFPEDVKKEVFQLLVNNFLGGSASNQDLTDAEEKPPKPKSSKPKAKKDTKPKQKTQNKTTKKKAQSESYKIDRNLDLRESADCPSFTEFYKEKKPKSTAEFNAVAVYYLIKLKGHKAVTLNQAYTCYSEVKKKPAKYFKQSFHDTQNKLGYIEFAEDGDIVIPHRGVVFVQHDLPKPIKAKK